MALQWSLKLALLSPLFWRILQVDALAKFTNVQCLGLDPNFTVFTVCRLHAVKRDVAELSLLAQILNMPKNPIAMRWQLLKRASGYKPFLYDVTLPDICEYLEKRNHPFVNIVFNTFVNRTNINKCPFKPEFKLEHFRFPDQALELIPLPWGEYALFATISFKSKERSLVKIYFTISEFR